jgi:DNA-binding transcriptional MerR regulator
MATPPGPPQPDLTTKLYYTIGEVSELADVKPHVLRYWESEFPTLRPRKGRGGSRRYRRADIEQVLTIRSLLYDQGFRIAGARKHLEDQRRQSSSDGLEQPAQLQIGFGSLDRQDQLAQIKQELEEIRDLLRRSQAAEG